jgi:hypothetical protein
MRRLNSFRDVTSDEGSAALEFVTTGMILLVPLVYLIVTVGSIQGGALAVEGASRQAARVYVEAATERDAAQRAETAVEFALADYGIPRQNASVTISCTPKPTQCLSRGAFVTVSVRAQVALPLAPPTLTLTTPLAVPVSSTATEQVSRFSEAG